MDMDKCFFYNVVEYVPIPPWAFFATAEFDELEQEIKQGSDGSMIFCD